MKTLIITLFLLLTSYAFAEDKTAEDKSKYNFWWEQIPAVCSQTIEIERWAKDKEFSPISVSYGREGGDPKGQIVYIVIYWLNPNNEAFASVQTPIKPDESCIVFRTFDLTLNREMIYMLGRKDI